MLGREGIQEERGKQERIVSSYAPACLSRLAVETTVNARRSLK